MTWRSTDELNEKSSKCVDKGAVVSGKTVREISRTDNGIIEQQERPTPSLADSALPGLCRREVIRRPEKSSEGNFPATTATATFASALTALPQNLRPFHA
ncbi:unnamed protein product [Caenorhabditis auriculariae]|uniref:Uncharacterized protein n=1 Tax=Caenorhabditis auriculariae TaxID=2777116 RepID=A0A8S1GN94_9PELO|nr:unnamed protein product [Caenorhabditis auriculariae]